MSWGGFNREDGSPRGTLLSVVLPVPTPLGLAAALNELLCLDAPLAVLGVGQIEAIFLDFEPEEGAAVPVQIIRAKRNESAKFLYRRAAAIARGDWLCLGTSAVTRNPGCCSTC